MSDWESSSEEEEVVKKTAPPPKKPVVNSKFKGEDEDEDAPASDWEESSEEEDAKPAPATAAAPPKKKGTLKAKLAEKEAARKAAGSDEESDEYDEDAVLDPREKARLDRERELQSDMANAAALFGQTSVSGSSDLSSLLTFNPKTKDDFQELSNRIIELVLKRHQDKPLYPSFVEQHVRALAIPLRDVEVRKAASALTTLGNEKQKEARDKTSGKKKSAKGAAKPALGGAKVATRVDTGVYEEALDDFGNRDDDFM